MSWEQLKAILDTQKQRAVELDAERPVACPICGAVLDENSKGTLNCPMGHYRLD